MDKPIISNIAPKVKLVDIFFTPFKKRQSASTDRRRLKQ